MRPLTSLGRNDADTDDIAARAKAVTDYRHGLAGMPTGICTTALAQRAVKCPLKSVCFGGKYPPSNDWSQP